MMKLHFEDDLDYQKAAIQSVVDLFRGQEISRSEFTVVMHHEKKNNQTSILMNENQLGIGNRLQLLDEEIHDNLRYIRRIEVMVLKIKRVKEGQVQ